MIDLQKRLDHCKRWLTLYNGEGSGCSFDRRELLSEIELIEYAQGLENEVARLKRLNESLADRVHAQSEVLSNLAMKKKETSCPSG